MNKRKRAGFTLAELLAVVAVIAVLVGIAIPVFASARETSAASVCLANRRSAYGKYRAALLTGDLGASTDPADVMTYVGSAIVCPGGGAISFDPDTVSFLCTIHSESTQTGGGTPDAPGTPDTPANGGIGGGGSGDSENGSGGGTGSVYDTLTGVQTGWAAQGEAASYQKGQVVAYEGSTYVLLTDVSVTNQWDWKSPETLIGEYSAIKITSTTPVHQIGESAAGVTEVANGSIMVDTDGSLYLFQAPTTVWWPQLSETQWVKIMLT